MGLFSRLKSKAKNDDAEEPAAPAAVPVPVTLTAADRAAAYRPSSSNLLSASYAPASASLVAGRGATVTTDGTSSAALRSPAAVAARAQAGSYPPSAYRPPPDEPASPVAAPAMSGAQFFAAAEPSESSSDSSSCASPTAHDAAAELESAFASVAVGHAAAPSEASLGCPTPARSVASEESCAPGSQLEWAAAAQGELAQGGQLSARRQIRHEMGPETLARLMDVFGEYANLGAGKGQRAEDLGSASFCKLCRECDLMDRRFGGGHADVVFTLAKKHKDSHRISFGEFCTALRLVAFRKRCSLEQVASRVAGCSGPQLSDVTTPDAVRLYDDLSTWTGVHFQVAAEAVLASSGGLASAASVSSASSLGGSCTATPGAARTGSLAELVQRQQQLQQDFHGPQKASAEVAAAEKRRRQAEAAIRLAESEAKAAVARAAAADQEAGAMVEQAAAAARAASAAIYENAAAAERAKREAAALHEAAAAKVESARAAERSAAEALRRAADAETAGQKEAEAALGVASQKERRARDAATSAWAVAAEASAVAEAAATAATEAASEGWSAENASQVAAAQEEAEAAAMAAILAAKQDAEAAMIDALMQAEAAEAAVDAARAEAAAASEALEAAKAEAAALLAAAAVAEAAAESEEAAKEAAQQRAVAAKEAATAAAVGRRKAAAGARREAERAAAAAANRRMSAAAAAQQAADAAVRAQAAVNSRVRAQQKLSQALDRARAAGLVAAASGALSQPATPEQRPPAAALVSPEAAAAASAAALEAARERFGDGSSVTTADLKRVWLLFASFGKKALPQAPPRMEGALFSKLCKECCLVDGAGLTVAQVDLTFGKVAEQGARFITFKQFLQALPLLAAARGCEEQEVQMLVAAAEGPVRRGTTPLSVRFHDRWGKA
ncbi:hypothetical protein D9Q98_006310 [Chlorella vulgaris]|uniref:Uncharacterized protein n=1 Tax=Chlorella vulgaris TaxID=3077 RepID=A0A9D4YUY4_CHLVU|nr:hypothetical protein D9Q98_006310 [Chlorella vulgaris]